MLYNACVEAWRGKRLHANVAKTFARICILESWPGHHIQSFLHVGAIAMPAELPGLQIVTDPEGSI